MKKMMKNLCSVAILLAMVLTMMPVVAFAADAATADYTWYGDGTATTFTLNDVNDLIGFNNLMAGADGKTATTFEGKTVLLGKDITYNDVTDYANWATTAPANQWTAAGVVFLGTFDGQGHTITGFYMAATDTHQGMFSALGGTVKNVSFVNAYVNAGTKGYVGTIVGKGVADRAMSIQNISVDVTLIGGAGNIGGIVASTNECNKTVTITNCSVSGSITSTGASNAGIVGLASSANEKITIQNCVNYSNINLSGKDKDYYSGGIVGQLNATANIINCVNEGTIKITLTTANRVRCGCIVGFIGDGANEKTITIKGCIAGGNLIKGNKAIQDIGGVVGVISNKNQTVIIDSCVASCKFTTGSTATSQTDCGAIVGFSMCNGSVTISNCLITEGNGTGNNTYSTVVGGTQTAKADGDGLISVSNVIFAMTLAENVYITNPLVNNGTTVSNNVEFSNVYYDASVVDAGRAESVIPTATGISAKTTEQLKSVPTGWTKWIVQDNTYPIPAAIVQANCVELIGYQNYTTAQDGKTSSYRFIAVVDELANLGVEGAMDYAGFKVSITVGNDTKTDTVWCNNAYTSLLGGVEPNQTTYRADQYGGEYFFFFTLTNVPASTTFEITLTPFVGTSSEDADLYEGVAKTLTLTTPAASGSAS